MNEAFDSNEELLAWIESKFDSVNKAALRCVAQCCGVESREARVSDSGSGGMLNGSGSGRWNGSRLRTCASFRGIIVE